MKKDQDNRELLIDLMNNVPGGLGIYHFYMDGRLEQIYLNNGYYSLLGVEREERNRYTGFSSLQSVYAEDLKHLLEEIRTGIQENRTIDDDIRVWCSKDHYKWLNVKANVSDRNGEEYTLFIFFSDIDHIKTTQLQLASSYTAMQIASSSGRVSFWLYYIDEKKIVQALQKESSMGYPYIHSNIPEAVCGTGELIPADEPAFCRMFDILSQNGEISDCTVRLLNHNTNKYEWRHIFCTRLEDSIYSARVAIGFSMNVDLEQENRQHYEREIHLRREMINHSVAYYCINLTENRIEECVAHNFDCLDDGIGIKQEDICQRILKYVDADNYETVKEVFNPISLLEAYHEGRTSITVEYRYKISQDEFCWVRATISLIERPETGETIAFVFCQDIDEEKKDQLAIENIMDEEIEYVVVIHVKSKLAHFVQINHEVSSIQTNQKFDYDQVYGEIIQHQVAEEDRAECENFFFLSKLQQKLEKEAVAKITYLTPYVQGKKHRKKARAFYLDESMEDIVLIRRDITDLYEEEQRQKKVLQEAVDTAVKANQAKSDFYSRMSHDMRTPLNAVLSFSSKEMTEQADATTMREYLDKIHTSGDYLLGIINDVLDMSKIEQNKLVLHMEPYAFEDFVSTIQSIIGKLCSDKNVHFRTDTDDVSGMTVLTDKVRFTQIFINLLSNAVKFTPAGGSVFFSISQCQEEGQLKKNTQFIVQDNGIGMSQEFLPHAFDSFSQEYNREIADKVTGTGLGLAIVKNVVDIMKGTITVESKLGEGTTFCVTLPLSSALPEAEEPKQDHEVQSLEGLRILICDDNEINLEIAKKLLMKKKCKVSGVYNGEECVKRFRNSKAGYYDAILMDIRMPVKSGIEATKEIRSLKRKDAAQIPIIAMTANAYEEDAQIIDDAGMNGYIMKPVAPEEMYAVIWHAVSQKKAESLL